MRRVLAIAALALGLVACADLPPLGTCGNGVVEATSGEDCDDPDPAICSACRLVCTDDLPADGVCGPEAQCCLAGQRCGVDGLCRAPSGVFATPRAVIPFGASQLAVADVDGDLIGDVVGLNRQEASFLFGTDAGDLTRTATAPIPTLSRSESQVAFLDEVNSPGATVVAEGTASVVVPTARGFAVLVASGGAIFSPPLPELEFAGPAGKPLVAAPSATGAVIAVVADPAGRVVLRSFVDRLVVDEDPEPCGEVVPANDGSDTLALLAIAGGPGAEHAVVGLTRFRQDPPTLEQSLVCLYATIPVPGSDPVILPALAPGEVLVDLRIAQLDGDACPEVVIEKILPDGVDTHEVVYFDTDPSGADCGLDTSAAGSGTIADGSLLGVGDLVGDGRDEVMIDREIYRDIGASQTTLSYQLPEALVRTVVVDVNRDGAPDLVAIGDSPDLTVVLATPAGYAPRTVGSTGSLRELVTGDFDADTFPDVATVEVLAGGDERVLVAFGGTVGPQALDAIGTMRDPHDLTAYVDRVPLVNSDAFADLFLVHDSNQGIAEVSQFDGSGTRALTSQIDLSGPPPSGDGGASFGRSSIAGELLRPAGDGTDFCTLTLLTVFPPDADVHDVVFAFCVGGQGAQIAGGLIDDKRAFTVVGGEPDMVDALDPMPIFVAARVGADSTGTPFPVIAALRRDVTGAPALVVMPTPPSGEPDAIESQVRDVFQLPPPPAGFDRVVYVAAMHAVELDGDLDSELLVTLFDFVYDPAELEAASFRSRVYRIDLAAPGNVIGATAVELIDHAGRDCGDAAMVELGDTIPGTDEPSPGEELVVLCADIEDSSTQVLAFYRGADGLVGPFPVGDPLNALGALVVGDVTGDRLDDLVIRYGAEGETRIAVMPQCAAHDTACAPFSIGSK